MPYLIYWIPKNDYFPLEQREIERKFEITDKHSNSKITCNLRFVNNYLHLTFNPRFQNIENLSLRCIEANLRDGFFIFEINFTIPPPLQNLLKEKIYHNFKELFHSHEHHGADEDVILKGYIDNTNQPINIDLLKRKAIFELINSYRVKFKARNKELIDLVTEIDETNLYEETLNLINETLKNVLSTLGEKTYFNFLYTLSQKSNLSKEQLEQTLFDIENLTQNLKILMEILKIKRDSYNKILTDYQTNLSITATIYFSLTFFIAGLIASKHFLLSIVLIFVFFLGWIFFKKALNKITTKKFISADVIKKLKLLAKLKNENEN